jgi:hypothetical protein
MKMILSFIAALASAFLGCIWIIIIWIPGIQLPFIVGILFFVLMIPFMCVLAAVGGLGNAVEAGAGSATGILNDIKEDVSGKDDSK